MTMEIDQELPSFKKPLDISISLIELKVSENQSPPNNLVDLNDELLNIDTQQLKTVYKKIKKVQKYLCSHPGCNKLFGKKSRLVVHERIHTGERPFKCYIENCNKSYTRSFHLTRHLNISHNLKQESKESHRCEKCNKLLSNAYSLKKHIKQFHKEDRYNCKECGQSFRKQQHLKTHLYIHSGIKPYKCTFTGCERSFKMASVLKRHELSHKSKRYQCPYDECSSRFDSYKELRHHLSIEHPKKCTICGKEFNMLCRLRTHLQYHDEIREAFFCPYTPCERYYFEQKNLHSHICMKHDSSFKGFECDICSKWLVTKQKLKEHLAFHDSSKTKKTALKKSRKPRKDKGVPKTDFAKLLSGYTSDNNSEKNAFHSSTTDQC